ncbi:MAG: glycosyl transferase family protein [uncultured bacterium]|nr:MAG: glycosyl transferase family protein [uncultured bacterium]
MKLSLCLAVYNEEKNLHYPLDSAIDLVDEVVIVDGGSTDKTVEIAKSYGEKVRIINSDNPVMFHKNKQKAIEAAKGEWILQLDADEELSEDLKKEIKKIISTPPGSLKSQHPSPVAFWLPRKNWFLTGFLMKGGQYPDYTIRLYKNGYARFPCKDVHENVEIITPVIPAEAGIQNAIGFLENPLLHYADPDFSRYLMRWDRYTTAEVERMPKDTKLNFFNYIIWKPKITFLMMYFRHKGFMDGFPGFVFALFSSIRFWVIYIKWNIRRLS